MLRKGYENFISPDCIEISRPEMGYNSAVVGRLGSNLPLPPSMKARLNYDDQDKNTHRFCFRDRHGLEMSLGSYMAK
jgi:hypothetical protein